MGKARILVVEDEFITAADIQSRLEEMGYEVPLTVDNGAAAIEQAGMLRPDIILMDITLVGTMTGIEAAAEIKERFRIPVIFLTAHSEEHTFDRALRTSPYGYVIKPFDPLNLRAIIDMALYKHRMEESLEESGRTILSLLNTIPDALLLVDRDRKAVAANDAMAARLGRAREGLPGTPAGELLAGTGPGVSPAQVEEVFRTGRAVSVEETRDGRWFQTFLYPVTGPDGSIARILLQSRDVTDARELKERLRQEGISRIATTIDQCRAMNEQIAASLAAIRAILGAMDPASSRRVEEELHVITSSVTQLDRSYAKTERARALLCQYFLDRERDARRYREEQARNASRGDPAGAAEPPGGAA